MKMEIANLKKSLFFWMGLISLIILEYCLFRSYILREIVPFYPRFYDQTEYLYESYKIYQNFLNLGFLKTISQIQSMPQTLLFPFQAGFFFLFFSPSRLTALSLNFLYFALLQITVFALLKKITKVFLYSFLFIGILLNTDTFIVANDFRIDFMAFCLYGIICCVVIDSRIFLNRKKTLVACILSLFLITLRYITFTYIFGVALSLLSLYLLQFAFLKNKSNILLLKQRISNLFIYLGALILGFLPVLWAARKIIHDYYIVGHLTGGEKYMRLKEALLYVRTSELMFYPHVFKTTHLTTPLTYKLLTIFIIFAAFALLSIIYEKHTGTATNSSSNNYDFKNTFLFLMIAIFVPLFVLTVDISKSIIVINIIMIPFLLLFTLLIYYLSEKITCISRKLTRHFLLLACLVLFITGFFHFAKNSLRIEGAHEFVHDQNFIVTELNDEIGHYANSMHWSVITTSTDKPYDYIAAPLAPFYYERHGKLFKVISSPLGVNIVNTITRDNAFAALKSTDIFISSLSDYVPNKIYPFEQSIAPYRHELMSYAEKNMVKLNDYYLDHILYRVYARPDVFLWGMKNQWITDQGLWMNVPVSVARKAKTILLSGESDFTWLGDKTLTVNAVTEDGISLSSHLEINDKRYLISVEMPKEVLMPKKLMKLHLTFSNSFTKEEKGNTLKLVMLAPLKKEFVLR